MIVAPLQDRVNDIDQTCNFNLKLPPIVSNQYQQALKFKKKLSNNRRKINLLFKNIDKMLQVEHKRITMESLWRRVHKLVGTDISPGHFITSEITKKIRFFNNEEDRMYLTIITERFAEINMNEPVDMRVSHTSYTRIQLKYQEHNCRRPIMIYGQEDDHLEYSDWSKNLIKMTNPFMLNGSVGSGRYMSMIRNQAGIVYDGYLIDDDELIVEFDEENLELTKYDPIEVEYNPFAVETRLNTASKFILTDFYNPAFLRYAASKYTVATETKLAPNITKTAYAAMQSCIVTAYTIKTIYCNTMLISHYEIIDHKPELVETVHLFAKQQDVEIEWAIYSLGFGNVITKIRSFMNSRSYTRLHESTTVTSERIDDNEPDHELSSTPIGEVLVCNRKSSPLCTYGYKAVVGEAEEKLLLVLKIPRNAKIIAGPYGAGKVRTNIATSIEFYRVDVVVHDGAARYTISNTNITRGKSFVYKKSTTTYIKNHQIRMRASEFNDDAGVTCAKGIHYYNDANLALQYHTNDGIEFGEVIYNIDDPEAEIINREYSPEELEIKKTN